MNFKTFLFKWMLVNIRSRPAGGGLTFKRGIFGNLGKQETMMSVCYGRSEDLVFSGATNGDVYIWRDTMLIKTIKAHDGPVFAMCSLDKVTLHPLLSKVEEG